MKDFSLKKAERLCNLKIIEALFLEGDSFLSYPIKTVYLKTSLAIKVPAQVSFSVSKKNFKKAVHRNLLKRRMREAYRLNKQMLYNCLDTDNKQLAVMFVFVGKEILEYPIIEKGMINSLKRISSSLSEQKD